jgi:nucleoid-associated protein YgaU
MATARKRTSKRPLRRRRSAPRRTTGMSTGKKVGLAVLALAAVGGVGALLFYSSKASAAGPTKKALPSSTLTSTASTAPLYVPPPAPPAVIAAAPLYTVVPGDSLSLIAREQWQATIDAEYDQSWDGAEAWLLLWSANYDGIPNPNLVHPGDQVRVPDFDSFSEADVNKARDYYLNWRAYSK